MGGPQCSRWCFTLNNFEKSVDYKKLFSDERNNLRRCVWGVEKGEQGTNHLQGYFEFHRSYRISHLKVILPRAHFEAARGNAKQNYEYCTKDGSFETLGDWEVILKSGTKRRRAEHEHKSLLLGLLGSDRERFKNSIQYIARKSAYDERVRELSDLSARIERFGQYSSKLLSGWQMSVLRRLFNQNDRAILWVYSVDGGFGKSFLAHFLNSVYDFELFDGVTKTHDIAHMLGEVFSGIVFDVTRDDASHFAYSTLESLKNGFVSSGKYKGIRRIFRPVPVIVFANFEPVSSRLSADRLDIKCLDGLAKTKKVPAFQASEIWPYKAPPPLPKVEEEESNATSDDESSCKRAAVISRVNGESDGDQARPGGSSSRV